MYLLQYLVHRVPGKPGKSRNIVVPEEEDKPCSGISMPGIQTHIDDIFWHYRS